MFDPKSAADINYIKGFDHGCDYIVAEIERYIKAHEYEPRITGPIEKLLRRLKMEDKDPKQSSGIAMK